MPSLPLFGTATAGTDTRTDIELLNKATDYSTVVLNPLMAILVSSGIPGDAAIRLFVGIGFFPLPPKDCQTTSEGYRRGEFRRLYPYQQMIRAPHSGP